jgi:hypothetical protein
MWTIFKSAIEIGSGFSDGVGADNRTRARTIIDDYRLAPHFGQLLRERPGHDVVAAAGRVRHDHAHRPARVNLSRRMRDQQRCSDDNQQCAWRLVVVDFHRR